MLNCFVPGSQGLDRLDPPPADIPEKCVWVDLLEPTLAEERAVERLLAIDVPSREEMREIETSSRLYEENGTLYMTATVVTKIDTDRPESAAITFILSHNRLITNRYVDPLPFRRFVAYSERHPQAATSAPGILAGLLEAVIERTADVLERVGIGLDELSAGVFAAPTAKNAPRTRDLRGVMERIGRDGDLTSKARESLVTLARQLTFLQQSQSVQFPKELMARYRSMSRDVLALSDHASFLANKSSFMLQATLGLINIEQNNIIKIFSVAAAMFLPPTLIASIYGMNFHFMPELDKSLRLPARAAADGDLGSHSLHLFPPPRLDLMVPGPPVDGRCGPSCRRRPSRRKSPPRPRPGRARSAKASARARRPWKDTQFDVGLRTYDFDRDNFDGSEDEALAIGGHAGFKTGYFRERFAFGATGYTSQRIYGPEDKDGTGLLAPGQEGYTVVGELFGELLLSQGTRLTIGRRGIDTPFLNRNDSRMSPNTFEAIVLQGLYGGGEDEAEWRAGAGYFDEIKQRNSDEFVSMATAAGAPAGVERGVYVAGANYKKGDVSIGAIDYYSDDIINIFYTEAKYALQLGNGPAPAVRIAVLGPAGRRREPAAARTSRRHSSAARPSSAWAEPCSPWPTRMRAATATCAHPGAAIPATRTCRSSTSTATEKTPGCSAPPTTSQSVKGLGVYALWVNGSDPRDPGAIRQG